MSVRIVILTHGEIGQVMWRHAVAIMAAEKAVQAVIININQNEVQQLDRRSMQNRITALDRGAGVLVLTDLYGASAANCMESSAKENAGYRMVSGLNLPMLLRVMNYSDRPLDDLTGIAIEGGRKGICEPS